MMCAALFGLPSPLPCFLARLAWTSFSSACVIRLWPVVVDTTARRASCGWHADRGLPHSGVLALHRVRHLYVYMSRTFTGVHR
ncbi:hypothetical protein L227DRAFT_163475 [Lentinus tigrinus ALCF2SS1-6]|uniref:Secreted protein n=1 Tax=Lentinus tigrinus ALCF2SS1-6 TaxID=1328759 RepID=A0A5C2S7L2_9APHY|nr:hypothetical protein L227DRAFT_163475 [Lentinus tigrinus ALCF2SS1-6]